MGSVAIQSARKSYGALEVLHGVSTDIADGEFVALVGPSGCGKSTLLRMIAGLEDITDGTISVAGRVVNDVSPKDRDIAMVFQSYALYPHMTVAKNMSFALRLARAPKAEIERRVRDAARILGLEAYLGRYPRQLSGGQRQRVAMGRAIVRDPQVFLFDEPLSNLDANLRVQMRSEIKALHQRLGTTTIYVTHDQIEAMTLADRIVVMQDGHIEQIGTPLELYDRPANTFVAAFIGSPAMNLIEGTVENGALKTSGGEVALPARLASELNRRHIILGIRPENFRLDENATKAEVMTVEPTGSETLVHMRLAGKEVTGLFRERIRIAPGDLLSVLPDPETLHVFDAASRERIAALDAVQQVTSASVPL